MKKFIKIFIGIVIVVICVITILAVMGSKSTKKENELAKSRIDDDISVSKTIEEYAEMSQDERNSICLEKYIEIIGKVDKITNLYIRLSADGFDAKCYVTNANRLGIDKNMIVTLDGICTYNASDNMRLRLSTVTNIDISVMKEAKTEENVNKEKDLSDETIPQQDLEETISGDANLDIVNKLLKSHNETRKAESIEYIQGGMLKKGDTYTMFSGWFISPLGLYGCSSELIARAEQLQKRLEDMDISDTGAIVYFEGNDLPEYYVDLKARKLYNTYAVGNGDVIYYLLDADDTTIKEDICDFYYDVVDELRQQLNKYEYVVNGTVIERNQEYEYVVIYGTACNAMMEQFEGYIRVSYYHADDEYDFSSESISVKAYSLEPSDSRSFEYDGQKGLFLEMDSVYKGKNKEVLNVEKSIMILSPNAEWQ